MPFGVAPRIRSAVVCGLSTEAESERDAGGVMIRKFAFNAATQIKACFRSASLALVGDALSCSRGDKHPQARSTPHECYLIQVAGFSGGNHPPPTRRSQHHAGFFFICHRRLQVTTCARNTVSSHATEPPTQLRSDSAIRIDTVDQRLQHLRCFVVGHLARTCIFVATAAIVQHQLANIGP